jgi:c-di-AMP phosphodiesterase-like protein
LQKHSDYKHRSDSGFALLVSIIIGLLFFSSYLAVERLSPDALPSTMLALGFLGSYAVLNALVLILFKLKERKNQNEQILLESLNTKMHNMFKYTVSLPYAIIDEQERVRATNRALQMLIGAKTPFFRGSLSDLCDGITLQDILNAAIRSEESRRKISKMTMEAINAKADELSGKPHEHTQSEVEDGVSVTLQNGRRYVAHAYRMLLGDKINYLVTFTDANDLFELKEKTERDMPAVAYIDVDNLEELTQYTRVNYRDASRKVDDVLVRFANSLDGLLREYERDRYMLLFSQEKLRQCEDTSFSALLDDIHNIRLGEYSIPVTVSMGVCLADTTMAERAKDAIAALDMALQRGGDQVAVRRREGIRFYGGKTKPLQRRTTVQSRVVANYLLSKISEADNLLIMGHKNPDFDSIASCVGIAQLGLFAGVPTKIIMDLNNANFKIATERLTASRIYADMFISGHKGLDLVRPGTLLIISDANNFSIIEAPDVAANVREVSGKIAIIDHHRQTAEYNFEPILNYIDPSASSAAELVTEILEQTDTGNEAENSKLVSNEVASVILSGIVLDTSNFTRNTGSRTLDAALYLLNKGANTEYVHGFFNIDYSDYICERSFSGCALLQNSSVGLTWSHGTGRADDDRISAAKEADKLLDVKGVHASFALVEVGESVHISARSDGEINVQLIMERMGGGGRYDSAGAALGGVTLEEARKTLRETIDGYFAELEEEPSTTSKSIEKG